MTQILILSTKIPIFVTIFLYADSYGNHHSERVWVTRIGSYPYYRNSHSICVTRIGVEKVQVPDVV